MMKLLPDKDRTAPIRILCLGAHCDDIEIGCGGTMLQLLREYGNCEVMWKVFCSNEARASEARTSAERLLVKAIDKNVTVMNFRDGFLPYSGAEVKERFEQIKHEFSPDIIFTHYRHDLHQDHRLLAELTWNTFRDHFILEYEISKYDGGMGTPNVYVSLHQDIFIEKIDIVMESYKSQCQRAWFEPETFRSLMRLRGLESNSPSRYAEAFYAKKLTLKI